MILMRKYSAKNSARKFPMLIIVYLLITIPLALFALLSSDSFDIRNRASETETVVNACAISLPYVNPSSIPVGSTIHIQVNANLSDKLIKKVVVLDDAGKEVFKKTYETTSDTISETFTYTSNEQGKQTLLGTVTATDDTTRPCVVSDQKVLSAISSNVAPEFKTLPATAKPSNAIKVNDSYEYTLAVEDEEGDPINYHFSFTPDATWLKTSVIEDGSDGNLTLKFSGVPDKPASYLANIFVHDGYTSNLRSQSWVISVDQDENDIPKVIILSPVSETDLKGGDKITVSWEVEDLNKITMFKLYISSNPGNQSSWIAIDENISPKVGNYIFDTSSMKEGSYRFIVQAVDNFTPSATGTAVSEKINIEVETDVEKPEVPDDGVVLSDPQIINVSPADKSKIGNVLAPISATLVAGNDSTIAKGSILVELDDRDITDKIKVSDISDSEVGIAYIPESEYNSGVHKVKVSFKDSEDREVEKEWTFEITTEQESETVNIFGLQIPRATAMIIGGGILVLLLALLVPWLLYLAWRGGKEDDTYAVYNQTTPPEIPETYTYSSYEQQPVQETVVTEIEQPVEVAQTPNFSTPEPISQEQTVVDAEVVDEQPPSTAEEDLVNLANQLEQQSTEETPAPEVQGPTA